MYDETDPVGACAPEAETADAFRAALSRIAAKIPQIEASISALDVARGEALLSGSPASVRAIETKIADARLTVERLRAWHKTIELRLPTMVDREKVAAVKALVATANAQTVAVCGRFRSEYPEAATLIASILTDDIAASQARAVALQAIMRDQELMRAAGVAWPVMPDVLPLGYSLPGGFPDLIAHLPGINPPGETLHAEYARFWPPAATQKAPELPAAPTEPAAPYVCAPVIEVGAAVPDFVTVAAPVYSGPVPGQRGPVRR